MTAPGQDALSATRDHLHPKIVRLDVNTKKINRQVWACRACNEVKGDLRLVNWKVFMAAHPQWWTLWRSGYFSGRKRLQNQQQIMKTRTQHET